MSALDTLTFQQPQEEFQEKVAQMFIAEGKLYKDIITGSQRVIESAIERVTIEIGIRTPHLFLNFFHRTMPTVNRRGSK